MPLWLQALLAILPIFVAAVLLVGFRLPARLAMPVVYVLAVLIGGFAWMMPPTQIVAASIQGLFIAGEIIFIIFWNVLYLSNSEVENWFTDKFLSALFVFLSTMALGLTLVYIVYISAKLSGFIDKLKNIKDPRKNTN